MLISLIHRITRLLVIICLVAGVTESVLSSEEPIQIGAIYNLHGEQSSLDIPSSQGAMLAVQEINKNGGLRGKNVELRLIDGNSDTDTIKRAAQNLTTEQHLPVIIGLSDTDMVLPAAQIAAESHTLFITSGATSPKLPGEVPQYLYLSCFGDNAQAAVGAEYAYKNLSARKAIIISDEKMQYTRLLADYFRERFEKLGGKILTQKSLVKDIPDNETPDIFYIVFGPEECTSVVSAIREKYPDTPIIGGDSYDNNDLITTTKKMDGSVYFTTHAWFRDNNSNSRTDEFITSYNETYGNRPDAFAGLGYDTIGLIAQAIRNQRDGSVTSDSLRESLSAMPVYQGVTGDISYNGSRIPNKSVTLVEVTNGGVNHIGDVIPDITPGP